MKPMKTMIGMLVFVIFAGPAKAAESLWAHRFSSESGSPVSLDQMKSTDPSSLVLFWASWCLPCKQELQAIQAWHQEKGQQFPKLRIVAISVDDASGVTSARAFLSGLKWPFEAWYDDSGQFFFDFSPAGQLPFSALINADGKILSSQNELKLIDLENRLRAEKVDGDIETEKNLKAGIRSETLQFSGANGVHRQASVDSAYVGFEKKDLDIQAQYDFIYLHQDEPGLLIRGDELGFSYAEYRIENEWGDQKWRLGDRHYSWLQGELLSLQNTPGLTNPASLRGGHMQWDSGDFGVEAFSGSVHSALFATPINPTTDVALPTFSEWAQGVSAFWHRKSGSVSSQISLNYVDYHRGTDSDLGYLTPITNDRWGLRLFSGGAESGVAFNAITFSDATGVAALEAAHPYVLDSSLWWSPNTSGQMIWSFHVLDYQSLPVRTLTPVLVENPALPLQVDKIQSFRLSPKLSDSSQNWWLEPIWIFEESVDSLPYERQNSYGLSYTNLKTDQKLITFWQEGRLSEISTYREKSFLFTTPLSGAGDWAKPLSAQILLRRHDSNQSGSGGDSDGLNIGVDLNSWLHLGGPARWAWINQWTRQSGYYFGFSGLPLRDLYSSRLEWTHGTESIRFALGSEPGGIVCTNGTCVQKPPLNGADFELALSY